MPENITPGMGDSVNQVPSFGMESDEVNIENSSGTAEHGGTSDGGETSSEVKAPKRKRTGSSRIMRALGLPTGEDKSDDALAESASEHAPKHAASESASNAPESAQSSSGKTGRTSRRQRPKKPTEKLDSVIQESVPGPAISRISKCSAFEVRPGVFATLLLNTDDIGGLNKKSANDADKGTIIQAMSNDKISIVATHKMLEDDSLVIIPTVETISMMEEFSLLVNAPYSWCLVDTSSNSELSTEVVGRATFEQCRDVALEELSIQDAIGGASGSVAPSAPSTPAPVVNDSQQQVSDASSGTSTADDAPKLPVTSESSSSTGGEDEEVPSPDDLADFGDDTDVDDVDEEYVDPEDDDTEGRYDDDDVSVEQVNDAIRRRFHDSRLGVEITTREFEDYVASYQEFTPFLAVETHGSSWLNDVIAAHTDAANAEISAKHEQNVETARQMYIDLVSNGIVNIEKLTSIEDPDTMYGKLKTLLDREVDTERARVEKLTSEELIRLHEDYERNRETAASAAAESARARYDDENQARLDRETKEVPERMANFIAEMRQNRLDDIVRDRRAGAAVHVDALINKSMEAMKPVFEKNREDELALARDWSQRISKVVDDHLKDDIARAKTIQDDLDRSNKIEALTQTHQVELAAKSEEYARHTEELTRNLAEQRVQSEAALQGLRDSLQARIDEAEGNARAGRERVEALQSQLATLQEKADERVEAVRREVTSKHAADIESWNKQWGTAVTVRRMLYIVCFALVILASVTFYMLGVHNGQSGFVDVSRLAETLRMLN